ncbi:hypothetical protein H9S87_18885 (plasmid) [Bacillus pumilus]|uniref:hypothetical protein n=1 Tax=Bacillus pumilus TaxID=1408 RepID=UPI0016577721|nr:hypothetical protein [Bacillus pumilus]QNP18241.1 hypothetical protein H9S87_18885 [Bacillus pumilus]
MANWVEGNICIKGDYERLKNFLINGLKLEGNGSKTLDEDSKILRVYGATSETVLLIDDTYHFMPWHGDDIEINESADGSNFSVVLEMMVKWEIRAGELLDVAKKYQLDIRATGVNLDDEEHQDIIIKNGKIVKDERFSLDDF